MRKLFISLFLTILAITGCGENDENTLKKISEKSEIIDKTEEKKELIVDVAGEVKKPGIYKLREGARVFEAIERAEGVTNEADSSKINMARKLKDGEQIILPNRSQKSREQTLRININQASAKELESIRGIGPSKAKDIVEHRKKYGPFIEISDIKKVNGIKDSFFEKIKDSIAV